MEIKELSKNEWDNFLKTVPNASIYQTSEYGLALAKYYNPLLVGLYDNDKIIAGAMILVQKHLGFNYGYIPRGYIIDYENLELLNIFTEKLKKFLLEYNIIAIKLSPPIKRNDKQYLSIYKHLQKLNYWHFGYNNFFEALNTRHEAVLDLAPSLEEIFYKINEKTRQKIDDAVKQGVMIYRGGVEDLTILHNQTKEHSNYDLKYYQDLYLHFNKRAQISIYYAKINTGLFLTNIQKDYREQEKKAGKLNSLVLEKQNEDLEIVGEKMQADKDLARSKELLVKATKINNQRPEGINVASALVITFRTDVYILFEGHLKDYRSFYAPHLLYWKIIEKYKKLGYQRLFLGGIANPNVEDNPYQKLNDFKLSFNAEVWQYAGDFELIINKSRYYLFQRSKAFKKIFKK